MKTNKRILLFIVGMHRSGTSALARAFSACGASTGDDVLAPMAGVNSEGFWEDKSLVALNEDLLHKADVDWYSIAPGSDPLAKLAGDASTFYQRVKSIVERGFGDGAVELVKDPRLCMTLPLWLQACDELDVAIRVCVIRRKPTEVAQSLQKRDGFPLSYGYWLAANYEQAIEHVVPDNICSASTTFDQLLQAPVAELERLITELSLPLAVDATVLQQSVEKRLKHQLAVGDNGSLMAEGGEPLFRDLARAFVARGNELSALGASHAEALSVIDERDSQIQELADQHTYALGVIEERDRQLQELGEQHGYAISVVEERDRQLQELGEQHGYAISVVEERDAQLATYNIELAALREELILHQSWKNKVLLSLGLLNREK